MLVSTESTPLTVQWRSGSLQILHVGLLARGTAVSDHLESFTVGHIFQARRFFAKTATRLALPSNRSRLSYHFANLLVLLRASRSRIPHEQGLNRDSGS